MASDAETLAAIFGGGSAGGGASLTDLDRFQQTIAQNDYLKQAAAPVLGARFNTSTWSPGTTAGVTAGQAFLGSMLQMLGQRGEDDQLAKVVQVMPDLYENPTAVQVPEGVDAGAFQRLKLASIGNDYKRQLSSASKMQDLMSDIFKKDREEAINAKYEGPKAKNRKLGEMEAYGASPADNPDSPQFKKKQADETNLEQLRKEFQATHAFTEFQTVDKGYRAMLQAIKDPSAVSDIDLVKGGIQMIEPGMSVNQGEAGAIANTGSLPDQWKAAMQNALTGGTKLPENVRQGIIDLAKRRYGEHARTFNTARDFYGNEADRRGLPPDAVTYLPKALNPEDVAKSFDLTRTLTPTDAPDIGSDEKIKDYARQMAAKGMTRDQIKAQLQTMLSGARY